MLHALFFNMRSIQGLLVVALLGGVADASLPAPARSSGGVIRALVSKTVANRSQDVASVDAETIDWASAKTMASQQGQADAQTRKMQRQATAQLSVGQLLQFLDDVDRADEPLSETDFVPRCLAHVQKVIKMVNATFGEGKLHQVVQDECLQNADYPLPNADAFNRKQACNSLVEDITKLRDQELKTGSRKGYFNFCRSYVRNKDTDGLVAPYASSSKRHVQKSTPSLSEVHARLGGSAAWVAPSLLAGADPDESPTLAAEKQRMQAQEKAAAENRSEGEGSLTTMTPSFPFIALTILGSLCLVGGVFFVLRQ